MNTATLKLIHDDDKLDSGAKWALLENAILQQNDADLGAASLLYLETRDKVIAEKDVALESLTAELAASKAEASEALAKAVADGKEALENLSEYSNAKLAEALDELDAALEENANTRAAIAEGQRLQVAFVNSFRTGINSLTFNLNEYAKDADQREAEAKAARIAAAQAVIDKEQQE